MKIDDLQNLKEPLHKILLITNRERVTLQWQNLSSSNQSKQREQQDRLNCVLFNRTAREEHSFPWLMLHVSQRKTEEQFQIEGDEGDTKNQINARCGLNVWFLLPLRTLLGIFLVVQQARIRLPMQGTQVPPLVRGQASEELNPCAKMREPRSPT